jgi:hypothetical protein
MNRLAITIKVAVMCLSIAGIFTSGIILAQASAFEHISAHDRAWIIFQNVCIFGLGAACAWGATGHRSD